MDNINLNAGELAAALGGAKRSGSGWVCRCPAHDDKNPSLSLSDNPNGGNPLVHCFAGCKQDDVVQSLKERGLWGATTANRARIDRVPTPAKVAPTEVFPDLEPDCLFDSGGASVVYHYSRSFKVCRFNNADGTKRKEKPFLSRTWTTEDGWQWCAPDSATWLRPLYNLTELSGSSGVPVMIVEGEKAADAAMRFSRDAFVVTAFSGGCGASALTDFSPLRGRDVVLFPDNDDAGKRAFADALVPLLRRVGVRSIRAIDPQVQLGWNTISRKIPGAGGQGGWDAFEFLKETHGGDTTHAHEDAVGLIDAAEIVDYKNEMENDTVKLVGQILTESKDEVFAGFSGPPQGWDEIPRVPFPLDSLTTLEHDAVVEVARECKVSVEAAQACTLTALCAAVFGYVDVQTEGFGTKPTSLNLITIQPSGEFKTTVSNKLQQRVFDHVRARMGAAFAERITQYRADLKAHKSEVAGIEKAITTKSSQGKSEEVARLRERLREVEASPPIPPPDYSAFSTGNFSIEGVVKNLTNKLPLVVLASDEAAETFGSCGFAPEKLMQTFGIMNKAWDGGRLELNRATVDCYNAVGTRGMCAFMMQPGYFREVFLGGAGKRAKDIGFVARYLICEPPVLSGTRQFSRRGAGSSVALDAFIKRLFAILKDTHNIEWCTDHFEVAPTVLQLDDDVQDVVVEYLNELEPKKLPGESLYGFEDVAMKSPEQAVRIAAHCHILLHGVDSGRKIDAPTMRMAVARARWYLFETVRVLSAPEVTDAIREARHVWGAVNKAFDKNGTDTVTKEEIRKCVTMSSLKNDAPRRDAALKELASREYIRAVTTEKTPGRTAEVFVRNTLKS